MRTHHRLGTRLAGGLTAGLAALLLAGCGGSDEAPAAAAPTSAATSSSSAAASSAAEQTGPEVAAAAADALEEAGSVHVSGTIGAAEEQQTVDLQLQGEDAIGTIGLGGETVQLMTVDGVSYFQAEAAFWTSFGAPEDAAAELAGRWVMMPAEEAADLGELTLSGLAAELRDPTDSPIEDEVTTEQLDGQDVLVVRQTSGSSFYVSAEDPQYPLQVVNEGEEAGTLTFDRFGETVEITAPADALDLSQLGA